MENINYKFRTHLYNKFEPSIWNDVMLKIHRELNDKINFQSPFRGNYLFGLQMNTLLVKTLEDAKHK